MRSYAKPLALNDVAVESTALDNWRVEQNWSLEKLSKHLGLVLATTKRYCSGQRCPNIAVAFWIEYRTHGQVPVVSWLSMQVAKQEFEHYKKQSEGLDAHQDTKVP